MPYEKGESGNPAGRPRGSRNRSTTALREALARLVDENVDQMSGWLQQIAADDPKAAFQLMLDLMDFHLPRVSRMAWTDEERPASTAKEKPVDPNPGLSKAIEEALRAVRNGEVHDFEED